MPDKIGTNVHHIRDISNLSQTQIAEFLGVEINRFVDCENGKVQFTVYEIERLGDLFGCEIVDLMTGDAPKMLAFNPGDAPDDLISTADINRIALNILEMKRLL